MRLTELTETKTRTVIVFKGLSHGVEGNQACALLAQQLKGTVLDYTETARALQIIKQQSAEQVVLIGYSAGAASVMQLNQQITPTLSILIAGYPTTLLRMERAIRSPYVNYYQQQELDGILRSKGMPAYKPQGGTPQVINADHNKIVGAVSADIIARVNRL